MTTTDVVPLPADDPRGLVFNAGSLPIVLGGLLAGVVVALRVRGGLDSILATLGIAVGGGLAVAGVLQGWLGALDGSYWANAGVVSLGIAAIGLTLVGLRRAIGMAGLPLGAHDHPAARQPALGRDVGAGAAAVRLVDPGPAAAAGCHGYGAPLDGVLRRRGRRAAAAGAELLGAGRGGTGPRCPGRRTPEHAAEPEAAELRAGLSLRA